jgi:uncharacterized protein (TIGR02145 family)
VAINEAALQRCQLIVVFFSCESIREVNLIVVGQTGAYAEYPYNTDDTSLETCDGDCSEVYGLLYNWYAVDDDRGICPEGWHVPTDEEWMELEMTLGMSYEEAHNLGLRGTDEGSQLSGTAEFWTDGELENNEEFGASGFNTIPSGSRDSYTGIFHGMGHSCQYWTSTATGSWTDSRNRRLLSFTPQINRSTNMWSYGLSVRCVQD